MTGRTAAPARRRPTSACLVGLLAVLVLAGCAHEPAPVAERSSWDLRGRTEHVVHRGETLYSIAWHYGLDWKELARRNGIGPPYTIHPGDRLLLPGSGAWSGAAPAAARGGGSRTPDRAAASDAGASSPSSSGASSSATASSATTSSGTAAGRTAGAGRQGGGAPHWSWPVAGKVVHGFESGNGALNKGLDIRGEPGARLTAAAPGEVVYAGSGLRGYGALVIVRHGGEWLSAYAHNHAILVHEGEHVGTGDALAELDGDGDRARIVHFEIRHRGDPVDPARLLPPR